MDKLRLKLTIRGEKIRINTENAVHPPVGPVQIVAAE
jgi:hypothetical protein